MVVEASSRARRWWSWAGRNRFDHVIERDGTPVCHECRRRERRRRLGVICQSQGTTPLPASWDHPSATSMGPPCRHEHGTTSSRSVPVRPGRCRSVPVRPGSSRSVPVRPGSSRFVPVRAGRCRSVPALRDGGRVSDRAAGAGPVTADRRAYGLNRPGFDGGCGYWIPTSDWSACWAA